MNTNAVNLSENKESQEIQTPDSKLVATALVTPVLLSACKSDDDSKSTTAIYNSHGQQVESARFSQKNPSHATLQITAPRNKAEAARFLQQASFSSTANEIDALMNSNFEQWINKEIEKPIEQTAWDWLIDQDYHNDSYKFNGKPASNALWQQLIASNDVLRKRVALALSEIFVISMDGIGHAHQSFVTAGYWDLLNEHAFGNYRDLLQAISLSPAMGQYLNINKNAKASQSSGRVPDENYAREILQLFSIGLYELYPNGSLKTDSSGQPIETYNQNDIVNLARVFTGWFYDNYSHDSPTISDVRRSPMEFNYKFHSPEEKSFLGRTIPAGTEGRISLNLALDTIFEHPNVAPFICRQLIQRLVKSNPSSEYIGRVADKFENNGHGVRGDFEAVVKAILLDHEARTFSEENNFSKLREPILRFAQWARQFNATSYSGRFDVELLADPAYSLGQNPLFAKSVFNFYRPNYVPPNTIFANQNLVAPEFQITDETSVAGYCNFIYKTVSDGIGRKNESGEHDITGNYSEYIDLAADTFALLEKLNLEITANSVSSNSIALMQKAIDSIEPRRNDWLLERVHLATKLILICPEYVVQK